jgi:hypothetical protein
MRARLAGAMLGVVAIVAGCGWTQPATGPDLTSVAFSSPPSEDRALVAAREELLRRCMAARGFTYRPAAPALLPAADTPPSGGYGLSAQFAKPRPGAARAPGFHRALLGSPRETGTLRLEGGTVVIYRTSGCYAKAMGTLYGSVRRYQSFVARRNALRALAGARLDRDPRLARAAAGWTRCMAARGFRSTSPEEARMDVYDAYMKGSDRAPARERATAAADRACGAELYSALARAQRDTVRAMSGAERATAVTLARARAAAVERARRTIS